MKNVTRRDFAATLGKGAAAVTILGASPLLGAPISAQNKKSLGVALVGLGSYSTHQLAPALEETQFCHLAGIVTGTKEKEAVWKRSYGLPDSSVYNYENFDDIANNDSVDIVYVVLPNSMHADFSIRAARAGKHVIVEKPMAMNVAECNAIMEACAASDVRLSVGYRMQSDPYTQQVKRFVRDKTYGEVQFINSDAAYISRGNPDQWRLNRALSGGGALMNMGVYSIQSSIYGAGENPISVSAQEFSTRPDYFKDTDETITAQFEFENGAVAHMMTSHNISGNRMKVHGSKGWFVLEPAHSYGPIGGHTSDGTVLKYPHKSQMALQMDDFAQHILAGAPNMAPGEMGKRDMIIVEAIYRSIREGGKRQQLDLAEMGLVRV
ncbi:Gfo/Idh/MocA family protein [Maribacter sp. 2307ULW6-5]|uniref:Gfo/Idh/MocA family protein n=1 Tax=Maribacter sp. 2307ULW6-5 TaxID=3386275 RepID=UPI0039BCC70F